MGMYKYLKEAWKKPKENFGRDEWRERLIELRHQPAVVRLEKPTRLDRARTLGYKAKQGITVVRSRVPKGKRKRPEMRGGRRPKRMGMYFTPKKSKQRIAEERGSKKYPNLEVLNSYKLAEDGQHIWFEVIMVNPHAPTILSDPIYNRILLQRGRADRGLTSAGKKGRK